MGNLAAAASLRVKDSIAMTCTGQRALSASARTLAPTCGLAKNALAVPAQHDGVFQLARSRQKSVCGSNTRKLRDTAPAPAFCRLIPCCPRRSLTGTSGRTASARSLRMPQHQTFPPSARPSSASEKNFPATHPPADLPAAPLRALRERSHRKNPRAASKAASGICGHGKVRFQSHLRDTLRQIAGNLRQRTSKRLEPGKIQKHGAGRRVFHFRRRTIAHNRAGQACADVSCGSIAPRSTKFSHASSWTWSCLLPRPFAALSR